MCIRRLQILLSLCCFLVVVTVLAEEGPPAKEGGGEEKSSLGPWVEVENKIQELSAKIKSKEANIEKLLEEKNHFDNDSPELKSAMKEVLKEHADLRKLVEDYEKNVSLLKYRFPERNAKASRKYDRIEVKSIDEMEQAMGIDGKLNRNMKRMRTQFKADAPTPAAQVTTPVVPARTQKKGDSIEDAGSVILQK